MIDKNLLDKDYSFTTTRDDGVEVTCDTLAVVHQENDDPIIIYTDYTLDQDDKFTVYVSKVVSQNGECFLVELDNYENIPAVQRALENIWNQ